MAYQRPFLVSLKKGDPQQPWGFRIFGGKEYGEPHVVEKVLEGSIAERCGLREGDEIIQVGRINIQDLTFGQAQEVLSRSGNKLEMFIIREDLLSPRKGKEPPYVKAVVHNPYNSPLNLYSTENIAETLAKQTEVLTEGHVSTTDEEEEGPENLTFKQKSAVFQLLEEQARQESANQYQNRGSPQRKFAPPPPPKPKPPANINYTQNKENIYYQPEQLVQSTYSTTIQHQPNRSPYLQQNENYYNQVNSADYRNQEDFIHHTSQTQLKFSNPPVSNQIGKNYNSLAEQKTNYKSTPAPPQRTSQSQPNRAMTTVYNQQQQPQYHEKHYQEQKNTYEEQRQWKQQQSQPQHKAQHVKFQPQVLSFEEEERESVFEQTSSIGTPITYKAPPIQKHRVNWPPASPAQQNGRWTSPSPTPPSPSKTNIDALWPPKQPIVKDLPRTGFNPAVLREQGSGRRCVWPPPKVDDEFRSGRTTPQSPVTGRRINWNPSPSPPLTRRSPFGSMSPVSRRKDIVWPPPQPVVTKETVVHHRPSPKTKRRARFDDYVKLHAASNVPSTYRAPPGTQHVEYC